MRAPIDFNHGTILGCEMLDAQFIYCFWQNDHAAGNGTPEAGTVTNHLSQHPSPC